MRISWNGVGVLWSFRRSRQGSLEEEVNVTDCLLGPAPSPWSEGSSSGFWVVGSVVGRQEECRSSRTFGSEPFLLRIDETSDDSLSPMAGGIVVCCYEEIFGLDVFGCLVEFG